MIVHWKDVNLIVLFNVNSNCNDVPLAIIEWNISITYKTVDYN